MTTGPMEVAEVLRLCFLVGSVSVAFNRVQTRHPESTRKEQQTSTVSYEHFLPTLHNLLAYL